MTTKRTFTPRVKAKSASQQFLEKQVGYGRKPGDAPLGPPRSVRLPIEIDEWLQTLTPQERVAFMRESIAEAVQRKLLKFCESE